MSESSEVIGKSPQSSDCKACQTLWKRFTDPQFEDEINFGSQEEALATQCPIHKPLVQGFIDYLRPLESSGSEPETNDLGISEGYEGNSVHIYESVSMLGYFWSLLLVKNSSVPNHPGTGRVLDPDWVDLDILKKWKQTCLSSHGAKCNNPFKVWPTRPAWLVDVEKKCLVPGNVQGDFVALSYANGRDAKGIVDTDTLAKLQEPHALDNPKLSEYSTPIIQRAMYLTSVIGERYLWADGLCIPQYDQGAAAEQLKLMGAISANAIVTIMSADGDAESGLPGLKAVSSPRKMEQQVIPFGDERLVVRNTGVFDMVGGPPYYEQAWTYQHHTMAQRKIIFNRGELHWECHCSVWHEELTLDAEVDKYIDPRLGTIMAGFPDLGSLANPLTTYGEKELRYDEDALPAISSLLSVASRSFAGGFLYGIPEMFFERGLGWRPHWDHVNLQRRIPSDRPAQSQLTPCGLPSWSWLGWKGLMFHGYGEAARINDRQDWIEETIPTTTWYTSQSPTDPPEQRRRIRSTWYENRDSYKDFTKPMPPGWTRHEAPATGSFRGEPFLYPDGCDKYTFKHEALADPDEEMNSWYFPFPVADIHESTPPFMPEQTQYLFCETSKAQLSGYQEGEEDSNIVKLFNNSKENIGSLHLHSQESLALFPKQGAGGTTGLPVDLVAVCKLRKYSKTWNEEKVAYDLPIKKEDNYLVLWVEWKDGIAYRLASGQVLAAEWEKLDLETVSLVLG
ncbi:hypothetical protein NM208_g5373 [Fusarium decemcellulare]|uniref:Uncharacterized protein n=1 Tax=Fusarium decemcellulare TaxID=57161 RepID=A0ACC1SHD1_9HYPO|nr:hypothetical protein NM208_g5373 [Fusarium decemcellulare]